MKVSTNSWHYKVRTMGDCDVYNDNLCRYFWAVMFRIAILTIMLCFLGLYVGFIAHFFITDNWAAPVGIGVASLILMIILPRIVITRIRKKYGEPAPEEAISNNILFEFIAAQKRKVCPFIDYVD